MRASVPGLVVVSALAPLAFPAGVRCCRCQRLGASCQNVSAKHPAAPPICGAAVFASASLCCILLPVVGRSGAATWPWVAGASLCNIAFAQAMLQAYARTDFGTGVCGRQGRSWAINESGRVRALKVWCSWCQPYPVWVCGMVRPISASRALAFALVRPGCALLRERPRRWRRAYRCWRCESRSAGCNG
jgi:hypothetical protein